MGSLGAQGFLGGIAITPTGEETLKRPLEAGHPLAKVADLLADMVETLVDALQVRSKPRAGRNDQSRGEPGSD